MHVEFRLLDARDVSCFDTESLLRMRQLSEFSSLGNIISGDSRPKLVTLEDGASRMRLPEIRIQFVLERIIKVESTLTAATEARQQHEKQLRTNWDGSEIRTKRYECIFNEAVVVSIPRAAPECLVKIRLIQVVPDGRTNTERQGGGATTVGSGKDSGLCIGVAKVTFRELLMTKGGIRIALQPKKWMLTLVEQLNLNTVATNGIFGKDVGGSAFVTFQVVSYAFGNIPAPLLLCFPTRTVSSPKSGGESRGGLPRPVHSALTSSIDGSIERFDRDGGFPMTQWQQQSALELSRQYELPAVRLVLIPYVVAVDSVLRLHELMSWQRPLKTSMFLAIICITLVADVVAFTIGFFIVLELITLGQRTRLFYKILPAVQREKRHVSAPNTGTVSYPSVLYSRHCNIINCMVRMRLFFTQGLQEDSYYELAFLFHLVRHHAYFLLRVAILCTFSVLILSPRTILLTLLVAGFAAYPASILVVLPKLGRRTRGGRASLSAREYLSSMALYRALRVSKVVHICVVADRVEPPASMFVLPEVSTGRPLAFPRGLDEVRLALPAASVGHPGMGKAQASAELPASSQAAPSPLPQSHPSTHDLGRSDSQTYIHTRGRTMTEMSEIFFDSMKNCEVAPVGMCFALVTFVSDPSKGTAVTTMTIRKLRHHFLRSSALPKPASATADVAQPFSEYFEETVTLLNFLRRNGSLVTYVTPNPGQMSCTQGELLRADSFIRPAWLVERSLQDGITSTLLAYPRATVSVGKLKLDPNIDADARALALLSAQLLQGTALSIYSPGQNSRTCTMVVPLASRGNVFYRVAHANPCPPSLLTALEDVWKSWSSEGSKPNDGIHLSSDVIFHLIAKYKDWNKLLTTSGSSSSPTVPVSSPVDCRRLSANQPVLSRSQTQTFARSPAWKTLKSLKSAMHSPGEPIPIKEVRSLEGHQVDFFSGEASRTRSMDLYPHIQQSIRRTQSVPQTDRLGAPPSLTLLDGNSAIAPIHVLSRGGSSSEFPPPALSQTQRELVSGTSPAAPRSFTSQ